MPNLEISKIKLGNQTYDIKDEVARGALGSGGTLSNKFGGAEYDSSTQKINFYPDTNNVTAQKLDDVDLSNMSLSQLHLTGTNSSNEPYDIGLSLGEDSDGNPAIVVQNNDPGYSGNEYYYIPILTGETAATLGEVVTNIDYYKSGTTYQLRLFTGASSTTPAKTIDVSDFVKDGMVSNVELTQHVDIGTSYPVLRISFNTDAGKQPIDIPLSGIFDPDNYLDKTEVVTSVDYDTTNGKITYTKNNNAIDVVTLDSSPTSNSKKPVTSGGIYTALSGKAEKSELTISNGSSSDKKIIQLKSGVSQEVLIAHQDISGKLNKYTSGSSDWDTAPTSGSTKPVTSGGLYTVLNNLTTSVNNALAATVLDVTYNSSTRTISKTIGETTSGVVILPTATYDSSTETLELVLASTPS